MRRQGAWSLDRVQRKSRSSAKQEIGCFAASTISQQVCDRPAWDAKRLLSLVKQAFFYGIKHGNACQLLGLQKKIRAECTWNHR